jgi:AAA ATPase domain
MAEAARAARSSTAVELLAAGRERELALLLEVVDDAGPRMAWVYGIAGIGKTTLLARFRQECDRRGARVVALDCQTIEPTESGFVAALAAAAGRSASPIDDLLASLTCERLVIVTIDTYEVFRIADPWLRHSLVPRLGPNVRLVIGGREPPMLEWATERARLGGMTYVPVGPLDDEPVGRVLGQAGIDAEAARVIGRVARGHPLALRLAIEAHLAGRDLPVEHGLPRVIAALATAFRDGLEEPARRALDAASVTRRVTRDGLEAMLGPDDADAALAAMEALAFVEPASDGLRLHETVQSAISERLRAVDPATFRSHRRAAWRHQRAQSQTASRSELWRSTADLLFLIDNPVVREALFPSTEHLHSVEPAHACDAEDVRAIWDRYEPPGAAGLLDHWSTRTPDSVRVVRDRAATVVGAALTCEWNAIPARLVRDDPLVAAWDRDRRLHPLPAGHRTLVLRRWLDRDRGEAPGPVQAAIWLDIKRSYLELRPNLGRLYTAHVDPQPYWPALEALGFRALDEPAVIDDVAYQLAALDFGPDSVDGWLATVAARELGIEPTPFLDREDLTVDVAGARIKLTKLEFGVLCALDNRRGRPVSRADLVESAWATSYAGGSNVVDVVVRGLRRKLGDQAARIETVRNVGYRLR